MMDTIELRRAFTLSETIFDRIRAFHRDRVKTIVNGRGPVLMESHAKMIVQLVPLASFAARLNFGPNQLMAIELVGFIRGLSRGDFTRKDLSDSAKFKAIKRSINDYVAGIPELESVMVWRNKVFAHFAITDPIKDDNISTLDMSTIFPVTFEGRYYVGGLTMRKSNPAGSHVSELPRWSLTEVFEALEPRFWPGLKYVGNSPPANSDSGENDSDAGAANGP